MYFLSIANFACLAITIRASGFEHEIAELLSDPNASVASMDAVVSKLATVPGYHAVTQRESVSGASLPDLLASLTAETAKTQAAKTPSDSNEVSVEMTSSASSVSAAIVDLASGYFHSTMFMGRSADQLAHLLVVLNAIESDVNEGNYAGVLKTIDSECNFALSQLANDAIANIAQSTSADLPTQWKDALLEIHLAVAAYVANPTGPAAFAEFKANLVHSVSTLLAVSNVAKESAESAIAADATNNELVAGIAASAIDTGFLCFRRCFINGGFVCCSKKAAAAYDPKKPNMIEAAMFIDNTVANIRQIIKEVDEMHGNLENLKLRIALRLLNLAKAALTNKSLENVYGALRSKAVLIMATMHGIDTAASWHKVKKDIVKVLFEIIDILEQNRPVLGALVDAVLSTDATSTWAPTTTQGEVSAGATSTWSPFSSEYATTEREVSQSTFASGDNSEEEVFQSTP